MTNDIRNRNAPTFDVDLKALKRKFLLLQQKAHPDSYSQASPVSYIPFMSTTFVNRLYSKLTNTLNYSLL